MISSQVYGIKIKVGTPPEEPETKTTSYRFKTSRKLNSWQGKEVRGCQKISI